MLSINLMPTCATLPRAGGATRYVFFADTGEWRHRSVGLKHPHRRWLGAVSYSTGKMAFTPWASKPGQDITPPTYAELLREASAAAEASLAKAEKSTVRVNQRLVLDQSIEEQGLLWFVLPSEVSSNVASSSDQSLAGGGSGISTRTSTNITSKGKAQHPMGVIALIPNFTPNQLENMLTAAGGAGDASVSASARAGGVIVQSSYTSSTTGSPVAAAAVQPAATISDGGGGCRAGIGGSEDNITMATHAGTISRAVAIPAAEHDVATQPPPSIPASQDGAASADAPSPLAITEINADIACADGSCALPGFFKSSCMDDSLDDVEPHCGNDLADADADDGGWLLRNFEDFVFPQDSDSDNSDDGGNNDGSTNSDDEKKLLGNVDVNIATIPLATLTPAAAAVALPAPVRAGFAASSVVEGGRGFVANAAVFASRSKIDRTIWPMIPKQLLARTKKAIGDFGMIKNGDRVILGLSGGKDSLCMLHVLHEIQQRAPIHFDLACVTMDPQFPGENVHAGPFFKLAVKTVTTYLSHYL